MTAVGPPLALTPDTAMPAFLPRPAPLYYPEASAVDGWAAEGWGPVPLPGVSAAPVYGAVCTNLTGFEAPLREPCGKVGGLVNLTQGMSHYLAAHPNTSRAAAVGYSEPLDARKLEALLALDGLVLPLGLPDQVQFAALLYNSTSIHALPTLVASLYDELLARATGGAHRLRATAHALPRTRRAVAQRTSFVSLFASIMILIPLAFAAAAYVTPYVRERESGSKQMQFVSGVTPALYWLASWTWDALVYLTLTALLMAVFLTMQQSAFTGDAEKVGATLSLLLLFGWATLPLSSLVSFALTSPSNALIAMIAFHFLSGFGLIVADFIMTCTPTQRLQPL